MTLVHLDKFHLGAAHPASARAITWGWLAIYAGVPVAMVVGLAAAGARRPARRSWTSYALPAGLRRAARRLAVVLLTAGVALLLAPEWAADALAVAADRPHRPRHRGVAGRARAGPRPTPG